MYARGRSSGYIHVLLFLFGFFCLEEVRMRLELWQTSFSSDADIMGA